MTTAAISAFGSTFKWNAIALAELKNISYNGAKIEDLDVSSHDSAGQNREYLAGWGDAGEITIEGNFIAGDTTGQIAFQTDATAKTTRAWIITAPGSVFTLSGNGHVSQAPSLTFNSDGSVGFTATIKISGTMSLGITYSNDLTALAITTATLYPSFGGTVYAYGSTIASASCTVTPTCAAATTIWVNGVLVASGVPSGSITLALGDNLISVISRTTNKIDRLITIHITRTA